MSARRWTALLALCLVLAGCSSTEITGKATTPAGAAATTTAVTPPPPTSLPPKNVGTVLLKLSELGEILGDPDVKPVDSFEDTVRPSGIDPGYACPGRVVAGAGSAFYNNSENSRRAMEGNGNKAAGDRYAAQVVAVFDTPKSADVSMFSASNEWRTGCPDGQQMTLTAGAETQTWTAGPVEPPKDSWTTTNEIDRITTTTRRVQPTQRTCANIFAIQGTVVVQSITCGPDETATIALAGVIVDRILAKLPK